MTSAGAFAALAEPRRRAILMLVRDEPLSVNEIAAHFEVTQQAVSQHLKVLKEAGLVSVTTQRQRHLYQLRPESIDEVREFLAELWPSSLKRLKAAIEAERDR
jgi:DNA-binding transcriptional ArsR family regulator